MKKLFFTAFLAINIFAAYAQSFTLRGKVVDEKDSPMKNVTVYVKERGKTEIFTDSDGKFKILLPDTTKHRTVVFSFDGYAKQEYRVDTKKNDIQIKMTKADAVVNKKVDDVDEVRVYESDIVSMTMEGSTDGVAVAFESVEKSVAIGSTSSAKMSVATGSASSVRTKEKSVTSAGFASPPPPPSAMAEMRVPSTPSSTSNIKSGTLTSGEVNDFAKWHLWGDILKKDFNQHVNMWGFKPLQRYIAQLTNERGMPLSNAQVTLQNSKGDRLWQAKTDNTGKAELWIDFFKSETETNKIGLKLVFEYEGKIAEITNVTPFEQGINTAKIATGCKERNKVDIFFMVDATGSMSDEMRYLQVELDDIIQKVHEQQTELELRTGCLVYRDHGDEYLTRKSSLSGNINETLEFLRKQAAGGGGDYPEAVDIALEESIMGEDWDDDALARILFIVLDAPSHTQSENIALLESQLRWAAEKGIRIVPIACSDIQKDGEYLMRTFALATNGTYLFLTDDSGVGNAHIKPTTDKYEVEKFNDAIVRVVKQYTQMPDCNNPKWAEENKKEEPSDKFVPNPYDEKPEENISKLTVSDIIKVYPNPCSSILKVDVKKSDVQDIYLVDMTGKVLFGFKVKSEKTIDFDVHTLSTGIYFVKAFYKGKWFTEKIIKM